MLPAMHTRHACRGPALETHTLESLPVMQLHHGIDLKRTVVSYFGVLHHSVPLVELHTARQVLLVPKHHLILGDACSQLQPERAAEPVRHNLQSPSLGQEPQLEAHHECLRSHHGP